MLTLCLWLNDRFRKVELYRTGQPALYSRCTSRSYKREYKNHEDCERITQTDHYVNLFGLVEVHYSRFCILTANQGQYGILSLLYTL